MRYSASSFVSMLWTSQFLLSYVSAAPDGRAACKALPDTPSWPSQAQWKALNTSISGQLIAPLPPAAVCDPTLSVFNNASCTTVASQWSVSDFHAKDPLAVMQPNWEDDACLPVAGVHCNLQQYPRYTVNATKASHVQAGVNFARTNNVRLIVRGTGHDYLGRRSTAPDSLQIWTHNIRGLQWHDEFIPKGCSMAASPAIKVAAGHRMFEVYDAAAAHGMTTIGGQDPDVGLGGHLTGGGHAPISGVYDLAADNVLEIEVVTPSGEIKTTNPCTNSDLWFALRGGGGGTFGVILSATLETHPIPAMTWSHFEIAMTSPTRQPFWRAAAYLHSQLPHLVKSGLMGYYNISSVSPFEPATPLVLSAGVWILNATKADFDAILDPVLDHIQANYPTNVTRSSRYTPNFYDWWKVYSPPGAVGTESQLGNRLLDEKALSLPLQEIADYLAAAYPDLVLLYNLVSGPGMWDAKPPGGVGSMTPAWRSTVVELIVPVIFPPRNATTRAAQTSLLTNKYMAALRKWAPDTGTYLNEADVNEPDLPGACWGHKNYKRLLNIKRKMDPEDVFWCAPCVGGEDWKVEGDGRVCRV